MAAPDDSPKGSERKVWAGTTLEERRAERRRNLMEAALSLIGDEGCTAVTVRSVCRKAGLTDRYFYENFNGRDDLVVTTFDEVAVEALTLLRDSISSLPDDSLETRARTIVNAFLSFAIDDPRKGRLLLVEPLAEKALTGVGVTFGPTITKLMRAQFPAGTDRPSRTSRAMTALGLTGSLGALFSAWLAGTLRVTRDELTDHCVILILNSYAPRRPTS
ncbi:TetR/AcrR family transcriptional regulator [Hoyosella altamirensis]|uniref:AcrR family transcriptional regulator n=1 Tax=Hoyosella altamirensis TaxID=616997 RepID=A0A839RNM0_9ACTN|nr:TetR/AcrR family transcriptional regulator [Hoyosella altamirensis]MBB3037531.1 AcrR family transcriptional regulator [Hoyosella altamirensis]